MDYETIIDSIVNEVLRRLENLNKKALVIFTGGSIGFNQAVNQLKLLKEKGWELRVFLSRNAEKVLTAELVTKLLEIDDIFVESTLQNEKMLLKDIKTIIIPVLTMNSASKIALGIADTAATHTVASAIMKGIPIIASKNACCPNDKERLAGSFSKMPEAYERKINSYLESLKEYGIKLVEADNLYEAATKNAIGSFFIAPGKSTVQEKNITKKQEQPLDKKLITREDIILAKNKGLEELVVSKKAIITALAKDAGRELGVEIRCI